ncbi:hypothetical protein CG007_00840 [Mesoplasma entomophilum]|nr:hypothetical protein CG007_00840 [Mesoplasma entomophilum]
MQIGVKSYIMIRMKKLLALVGSSLIVAAPASTIVACTYIDTEQKSIDNKLKEVVSSTSSYFKGAILANAKGINGQTTDKNILKMQSSDIIKGSTDKSFMSEIFNTFLDLNQTSQYMSDVYNRKEFNVPVPNSEIKEKFDLLNSAFKEIYKLIGVKFDPVLWKSALPMFLNTLGGDTIKPIQNVFSSISDFLIIFKDVNVPNYSDLIKLGVLTNNDLKIYFSSELTMFLSSLMGNEISNENAFDFTNKDKTDYDFYKWNSKQIQNIFANKEFTSINFSSKALAHLMNALFGMSWYISSFTTEEFNIDAEDIIDDNHILSKEKTNIEIIKEVNARGININIVNAPNIDGILQFIYDLLSNEKDPYSYKTLRIFKILFQVDDDIIKGNESLNFNKKIIKINETTLDFKLGDWANNGKVINGGLNLFLSSSIDGLIRGLIQKIDTDGGIMDFLNSIELGSEQISGLVSGLISSLLSGIDMTDFVKTMFGQFNISILNITKWNEKIISKSIKEKITSFADSINSFAEKWKWLVEDDGVPFFNKFIAYLFNTDVRTILERLHLDESLPIQLPKISIKDIINIKITSNIRIGDLLSKGTEVLSLFINIFIKGAAPKLYNISEAINDTSIADHSEFKMVDNYGSVISIEDAIGRIDKNLIITKNGKVTTSNFALAKFCMTYPATKIFIPTDFGLKDGKWMRSTDAARWIMGIGIELEDGIINNNFFREKTIMYELSQLWEDETGMAINYIFEKISDLFKAIDDALNSGETIDYADELQPKYFSEKLISYKNMKDGTKESLIEYEITYSRNNISKTYKVNLVLPAKSENMHKYQIIYFGIK